MWSLITSWWGSGRKATWSTSLTLAWPRNTVMPERTSTSPTEKIRTSLVLHAMPQSTPTWVSVRRPNHTHMPRYALKCFLPYTFWFSPQSSQEETTWSLWVMFSCTSTWVLCHGRASKLLPRGRSMSASVKRKCPPPSRCFAKDTLVREISMEVFWIITAGINNRSTICIFYQWLFAFFRSWVFALHELVPLSEIRWQARLLLFEATLQEPFPQTGLLLWLRLRLEHAEVCEFCGFMSTAEAEHFIVPVPTRPGF